MELRSIWKAGVSCWGRDVTRNPSETQVENEEIIFNNKLLDAVEQNIVIFVSGEPLA